MVCARPSGMQAAEKKQTRQIPRVWSARRRHQHHSGAQVDGELDARCCPSHRFALSSAGCIVDMSADECKSLALRSKLALHVNFDESCAEVAYYLRIELEPGPSRVYRLLDLPIATRLPELDVLVEPISIEGRVQPSSELVVRGARALRIAIDMEHAASGPQLRAERTKSAILLHAPNVLPYPENARKNRKFLVILHGVAAYVRTPPYDVHVLLLPRPYSLNNRILVTASDSVLDLYEPFGPAAVDAEPPILGNNKPTRRIKDAGADDTTTFRGSEYGADEVDGLSFSGGFEGSRRPITLRWGPAAEDLAYMDVEKAACTLSLVPQGDVGHPTYFAFECVVRLADLHLPWIAEGGVVRYVSPRHAHPRASHGCMLT